MAELTSKIREGVFAINKPPHLSSAQVLRDLQSQFIPSTLFAPLLEQQKAYHNARQNRRKKRDNDTQIKMGHGGTLDPLATGILIVGVGKGTKRLQNFLGCTKTYQTVVLFGKATDTYDVAGRIVAEAPYGHITAKMVEEKLAKFRGSIQQVPPVYSALKIDGMKAYEYARSGKELPRELESRPMEVQECELVKWYEGGKHDFRWPAEEASKEGKKAVTNLMGGAEAAKENDGRTDQKRKSPPAQDAVSLEETTLKRPRAEAGHSMEDPIQDEDSSFFPASPSKHGPASNQNTTTDSWDIKPTAAEAEKAGLHTHIHTSNLSCGASPAPAAAIRLKVSSGFYVRSFAHDLGLSLEPQSYGIMASLVRSEQDVFNIGNALAYDDLEGGEGVWGPKVATMLEKWMDDHPEEEKKERNDDRGRSWHGKGGGKGFSAKRGFSNENRYKRSGRGGRDERERRNSSSPEGQRTINSERVPAKSLWTTSRQYPFDPPT